MDIDPINGRFPMKHDQTRDVSPGSSALVLCWGALLLVSPALGLAVDPAPETTITAVIELIDGAPSPMPPGNVTVQTAIAFEFTGSDDTAIAGFECSFDGSLFAACSSPASFDHLSLGEYHFAVRAVDTAGNRDASPAGSTVIVDQSPDTSIRSAVDGRRVAVVNGGTSKANVITFTFSGTDNGSIAGFECRLDFGTFQPCTSPVTYDRFDRGPHTFRVQAVDNRGLRDPDPAIFTWSRR
jgi:large repetitive protein